jgi:steroid delta-isomerase-like uncharacterized protein
MDNGQIARGVFEELFGKGRLEFADQNYDRSFRGHDTLIGDFGADDVKKNVQLYRSAFPDLSMTIDELIETAEKVLVRWSARGTHRGAFLGKLPTNKQSRVQGISVLTFQNGKITEDFTQWNVLGLLRDLGLAPELDRQAPQPSP